MMLPLCEKCGQVYLKDEQHRQCPHCQQVLMEATKKAWFPKETENELEWGVSIDVRDKLSTEKYVENLILKTPRYHDIQENELNELDTLSIGDRSELLYSVSVAIDLLSSHYTNLMNLKDHLSRPVKLSSVKPPELRIEDLQAGDIISLWENGKRNSYYIRYITDDIVYGLKLRANGKYVDKRAARSIYGHSHRFSQKQLKMGRIERRNVTADEVGYKEDSELYSMRGYNNGDQI